MSDYNPVPPRSVKSVNVRYVDAGRGLPLTWNEPMHERMQQDIMDCLHAINSRSHSILERFENLETALKTYGDTILERIDQMGKEAKILAALEKKAADLQKQFDANAVELMTAQDALKAAQANAKDADDVAAETAAATALNLDANGDPIPAAPPA